MFLFSGFIGMYQILIFEYLLNPSGVSCTAELWNTIGHDWIDSRRIEHVD